MGDAARVPGVSRQDKKSEEDRAEREDEDERVRMAEEPEEDEGDEAKADDDSSPTKANRTRPRNVSPRRSASQVMTTRRAPAKRRVGKLRPTKTRTRRRTRPSRTALCVGAKRRWRVARSASAGATKGADEDEASLPKDKNARAKELLKRRREQAPRPRRGRCERARRGRDGRRRARAFDLGRQQVAQVEPAGDPVGDPGGARRRRWVPLLRLAARRRTPARRPPSWRRGSRRIAAS